MGFRRFASTVWENVVKHQGEKFYTKTGISYTYVVREDYILVNNDRRRKITKEMLERAALIENPLPAKLQQENIGGPSYA